MSVKEITELSLTDFWKEYQSNFNLNLLIEMHFHRGLILPCPKGLNV